MSRPQAKRAVGLPDLTGLAFENTFVRELPGDAVRDNVPRQVRDAAYTRVDPTPVAGPRLLGWSEAMGTLLGIGRPSPEAVEVLAGNRVLPGMQPYAARYGGHQFGHWAGQLGDGRAITLAEVKAADGTRQEIQLKGAGLTPYSRTADGRAVLRSSLREFACSEALHFLGVPTTRALSLVSTGEPVIRDMFYDGNARPEPGAIVCRVAPSFVRLGNFQVLEEPVQKQLLDYVIRNHFTGMGTAAASAVAADALAAPEAKVVALLGSGVLARSHAAALRLVRPLSEIRVWSRDTRNVFRCCDDVKGIPANTAEQAVRGADIVCTVTNASEPVLEGAWLKPGAFVAAVGAVRPTWRELDDEAMRNVVIADNREAALSESGDVILSKAWIYAEIGEILAGTLPRPPAGATVIFKSLGQAVEDAAAARLVYEAALSSRAGG